MLMHFKLAEIDQAKYRLIFFLVYSIFSSSMRKWDNNIYYRPHSVCNESSYCSRGQYDVCYWSTNNTHHIGHVYGVAMYCIRNVEDKTFIGFGDLSGGKIYSVSSRISNSASPRRIFHVSTE